jgi:hypothetical protein
MANGQGAADGGSERMVGRKPKTKINLVGCLKFGGAVQEA